VQRRVDAVRVLKRTASATVSARKVAAGCSLETALTRLVIGQEGVQQCVVRLARRRDRVAAPGNRLAPRIQALGERVADRLERTRVPAGDDELAKPRRAQLFQGRLGLPRRAFAHAKPRALQQLVAKLVRRLVRGADAAAKRAQELQRLDCQGRSPKTYLAWQRIGELHAKRFGAA
jgi:hypothetical protein